VLEDLRAGKFLEAAIIHNQQVSGISVRELQRAADDHKIAINEIEVVGADHIHEVSPNARFLFILPPSFDEWVARMNARGPLPQDEIRRRLESAVNEIVTALDRDYYTFVVNDTFAHTARRIDGIIREHTTDADAQAGAQSLARELLADTRRYLVEHA
jgi:guanylate kinase